MEANWISELSVACTVLDTDGKNHLHEPEGVQDF